MFKFAVHFTIIVLVAAAHSWAYWSAMTDRLFDWSAFSNFLPFLLIVALFAGAGATLAFFAGFWAQNRFKANRGGTWTVMFAVVYLIWSLSAFVLYVANEGVDAYSATLGVFIYMPIHCAAAFFISLLVIPMFGVFVPKKTDKE